MRGVRVRVAGSVLSRVFEALLLVAGVASLTAFGLMKLGEIHGQAELRADFERRTSVERLESEPPAEAEAPPLPPNEGEALGRLRSERIGLDVMIAEGVGSTTLKRAAGRIPGTALPGRGGNIGLAAHRDTFFRPLREIRQGDELEFETVGGTLRYRVQWTAVVEPSDVASLKPTSKPSLTLVTCFPFQYVGPAPQRFIVRAALADGLGPIARAAPNHAPR